MIVDDSLVARGVLSRIIESQSDLAIVAKATTAEMALARLDDTAVDVMLLDLEMPGMGGIGALPELIARLGRGKVLVVSALTARGAEHTLAALSLGAADTLLKPRAGEFDDRYAAALIAKVRALAPRGNDRADRPAPPAPRTAARPAPVRPRALAVGASTGGIHALCRLLGALPPSFDLPILVAQHLPGSFMPVLARQLHAASGRPADVAQAGMEICPGTILVAPGSGHLVVHAQAGRLTAAIDDMPAPSGCTPSADPLFASLARATEGAMIAVVLSGMGRDGYHGAVQAAAAGAAIFAQDAASSAVWGMPCAVAEAGLAAAVLPPEEIALRLAALALPQPVQA